MNDRDLYRKCVMYGRQALKARRKFIGLLPEVFKRKLFLRKGFASIYEFAARLAGVSHEQVNRVLRLDNRVGRLPVLHSALVNGVISANKLARVVSIASVENQESLVRKMDVLSSRALEVFVRNVKRSEEARDVGGLGGLVGVGMAGGEGKVGDADGVAVALADGLQETLLGANPVHVHGDEVTNGAGKCSGDRGSQMGEGSGGSLHLDPDVESELRNMQSKGIDVNAFLRAALETRKREIENQKREIAEEGTKEQEEKEIIGMPASRYIPAKVRKIITGEYGNLCGKNGCNKRSAQLHHVRRFARVRLHDPRFLKPLCAAHHELEHAEEADWRRFRGGA